jgi:hypothetical protein
MKVKIVALRSEYIVRVRYINKTGCLNIIIHIIMQIHLYADLRFEERSFI